MIMTVCWVLYSTTFNPCEQVTLRHWCDVSTIVWFYLLWFCDSVMDEWIDLAVLDSQRSLPRAASRANLVTPGERGPGVWLYSVVSRDRWLTFTNSTWHDFGRAHGGVIGNSPQVVYFSCRDYPLRMYPIQFDSEITDLTLKDTCHWLGAI